MVDVVVLADAVGEHVVVVVLELPPLSCKPVEDPVGLRNAVDHGVAVVVARMAAPPAYDLREGQSGNGDEPIGGDADVEAD